MIHQQDPVGLIAFDRQVTQSLPPRSKRSQLGNILALLAKLSPSGETEIAKSLHQVASMIRHKSLIMIFSDFLGDFDPIQKALHRLRFSGHDIILFHILDEAEALFHFEGMLELEDNETKETLLVDAEGIKADYLEEVAAFQAAYKKECVAARIDYVPLHTGMPFDKALMSYLLSRQSQADKIIGIEGRDSPASERGGKEPSKHHGYFPDQYRSGGRGDPGSASGCASPVHAPDTQARDLSRSPLDSRASEAFEEEAPRQELAPPAGEDGGSGLDGAGSQLAPRLTSEASMGDVEVPTALEASSSIRAFQ